MGTGTRRAYKKGMGLLGDQGTKWERLFFSLPWSDPRTWHLALDHRVLRYKRYPAVMYLPLALLRYKPWHHGLLVRLSPSCPNGTLAPVTCFGNAS
jgi:hypothetical protein